MSRSYLFIPGDVPRMLQNLDVFDADSIIIDFEDSVAIDQKDEARLLTQAFLSKHHFKELDLYIRVNDVSQKTLFEADMQAIKALNIHGIVLPKVTLEALDSVDAFFDRENITFPIIGIIETPLAVLEAQTIAKHKRIQGLLLGAEDLTKDLGTTRTLDAEEILFARSQIVFAAKAYQKEAIDTPYVFVRDEAGLAVDAQRAARLGFTAKASIHPNHVETIHHYFSPSKEAIHEAKRIVAQSKKLNSMRFSLDGSMVDKPVIDRAKALLKRAEKYGVLS